MEFKIEPITITKDLILSKVTEETIMEHYLGIPVKKGLFKSTLRKDNRPTVAFYRNPKGVLMYKDFGDGFTSDFIGIVMYKFSCSYGRALRIIANDFNIISNKSIQKNLAKIEYSNTKFEDTKQAIIQVEIKNFDQYELDWWAKYGITEKTLKKFKVFSCKNVFLNNELFNIYKPKQLIFGYYGGVRECIERWRIYYPGNKKYKFVSNWKSFRLQGAHMLPKEGEFIVITKALKDVMVLYSLGIPAIAPISENCFVTDAQWEKLKHRFKYKILLYDNDRAGKKASAKFRKLYKDLDVLLIPKEYKAKDISDFYKLHGKDKTLELIEKAKNYIRNKGKKEKKS